MNERIRQRAERRETLRLQCAEQREHLAASLQVAREHLQPIDHALTTLRALRRTPLLFGGVAALTGLAASLLANRGKRRPLGGKYAWLLALAGPLLNMLEHWWRERHASPPERPLSDPTAPANPP